MRAASDSSELGRRGRIVNKAGYGTLNLDLGVDLGVKRQYKIVLNMLNLGDKTYTSATENILARGRSAVIKFVAEM